MKQLKNILLILVLMCFFSCTKVSQNEIAIRVNKIPLPTQLYPYPDFWTQGVLKGTIKGGQFTYYLPFLQKIYKLDISPRIIKLGESIQVREDKSEKCLRVKTSDGNNLYLKVNVRYRPYNFMAERIILNIRENSHENSIDDFLEPLAISSVREVISTYNTDQLIDSERFSACMKKARIRLNKKIERFGFEAVSVNIETPLFDQNFENRMLEAYDILMEAKKIEKERDSVLAKIATDKLVANMEVTKKIGDANKYYESRIKEADAIYNAKMIEARGKEIELTNTANGLKAVNQALGAIGGENLVAFEMAKTLQGKKILLLPSGKTGMNVNLNELINKVYKMEENNIEEKKEIKEEKKDISASKEVKKDKEEIIKKAEEVMDAGKKEEPIINKAETKEPPKPETATDSDSDSDSDSDKNLEEKADPTEKPIEIKKDEKREPSKIETPEKKDQPLKNNKTENKVEKNRDLSLLLPNERVKVNIKDQ